MLEACSIDVEDRDIILKGNIPYMFDYDNKDSRYIAGPMLQGKKWFDLYLNGLGFEFIEKYLDIEGVIKYLKSTKARSMIGLKIDNTGRHACVFLGIKEKMFIFMNNKHRETEQKEEFAFAIDEVYNLLEPNSSIGYISAIESNKNVDYFAEMKKSLNILERYREEIISFVSAKRTDDEIMISKQTLFEALLLDIASMLDIIGERELLNKIADLRGKYLNAIKRGPELVLKEYVPTHEINIVIDRYVNIIKKKMAQVSSV